MIEKFYLETWKSVLGSSIFHYWKSLEDIFARGLEDVLKTSWRHLENVSKTSWRHVGKTNILFLTKTSWRRLEDVLWRRKAKGNIFVLIKTSWRRVEDVFWRRRRMFAGLVLAYYWVSILLTHSFPMHPFSSPWKHQKTVRFSEVFRGKRKGALGTNRSIVPLLNWFSPYQTIVPFL